jgi:hypothetical protein
MNIDLIQLEIYGILLNQPCDIVEEFSKYF